MHNEKLYELKEKLMKELEEYSENGKYSKEDVETIKYIASAIDHICNVVERAEDEEYSQRGYAYDNGNMGGNTGGGGSYRGGNYYRNGGGSYRGGQGGYSRNGGSYARGRGQNAKRDSMGRYSSNADPQDLVMQIEDLMQDAPNEQIKQQMQNLVQQLEQM